MNDEPFRLSALEQQSLRLRYSNKTIPALSYGTVSDYCDSVDHIPFLTQIQADLKDLQRPSALKMILAVCPPGSRLLEIGAGEPYVAQMLTDMGYRVCVVDPYDGSGRGPTEFEYYRQKYPDVHLVRDLFNENTKLGKDSVFDCFYSISVLEHVHQPFLTGIFAGVKRFLKPGGYSLHLIDHVLDGDGAEFHFSQVAEIICLQGELSRRRTADLVLSFYQLMTKAASNRETYFLSPAGHQLWRGATPYESFPFRKVISISSCEQFQFQTITT
jgi:SAM-dependent methyltransferase